MVVSSNSLSVEVFQKMLITLNHDNVLVEQEEIGLLLDKSSFKIKCIFLLSRNIPILNHNLIMEK